MVERADVLVIGAGMAGASAAYELAAHGRVVLLEREEQPGYHATGRSAALYSQTYGHPTVRALTVASWEFYGNPPDGFAVAPLLTPRGVLLIGGDGQRASLAAALVDGRALTPSVRGLDTATALALVPALRPERVAGAVLEPDAMDMDVHAIHQGYLRGLRARGGRLVTGAGVMALVRRDGVWTASSTAGEHAAPVVVNAAGAWADRVAALAGARTVGLQPKRRTAVTFDPVFEDPALAGGMARWPMVIDVDEAFYVKPEGGRLLASPADETPSEPCDIQPEELDVAVAADRVESAFRLSVRRIGHRWAGLRSFVEDRVPVVGFAPDTPGFFWLAGQGGYGIQTAPAMARTAAALVVGGGLPAAVGAHGVTAAALAPERLWMAGDSAGKEGSS